MKKNLTKYFWILLKVQVLNLFVQQLKIVRFCIYQKQTKKCMILRYQQLIQVITIAILFQFQQKSLKIFYKNIIFQVIIIKRMIAKRKCKTLILQMILIMHPYIVSAPFYIQKKKFLVFLIILKLINTQKNSMKN